MRFRVLIPFLAAAVLRPQGLAAQEPVWYVPVTPIESGVPELPEDYCHIPPVYGRSVEQVASIFVGLVNHTTGPECGGVCRNPVELAAVTEAGFTVRSLCTGLEYHYPVTRLVRPPPQPVGTAPGSAGPLAVIGVLSALLTALFWALVPGRALAGVLLAAMFSVASLPLVNQFYLGTLGPGEAWALLTAAALSLAICLAVRLALHAVARRRPAARDA